VLSEAAKAKIESWVLKYPPEQRQSGVLYALTVVQQENKGYLTESLMDAVAEFLKMPPIAVYEVASFYSMFELNPVGKHVISICTNISCMLCGSDALVQHFKHKLGIGLNETTEDGLFTLKEVECLAACGGAPVLQIKGKYCERVNTEAVDALVDGLIQQEQDAN
jgi:NADH-quinone oxidoreductase subunit E